jgi:hypothetical protein
VLKTLVEALLADLLGDETDIKGISSEHSFHLCREWLLVSSDATLFTSERKNTMRLRPIL